MYEHGFYQVCWLREGREVARHAFDDLLPAKQFAKDRLQIQRVRNGADCARVIDVDGISYFEFKV